MPARAITVTPKAGELPNPDGSRNQGGAYAELEVPNDYEIVLTDVNDYDKRSEGKSYGWIFTYSCETPSGNSVSFDVYVSFLDNARWKLYEVANAHRPGQYQEGVKSPMNPNEWIGEMIGGHIDFPRDKKTGQPTSTYRGIEKVFPLPSALGEDELFDIEPGESPAVEPVVVEEEGDTSFMLEEPEAPTEL